MNRRKRDSLKIAARLANGGRSKMYESVNLSDKLSLDWDKLQRPGKRRKHK